MTSNLDDDDAEARLDAVDHATAVDFPRLLQMALTDVAEVQVAFGVAEQWRVVGDAAAGALAAIVARGGVDLAPVRGAALDLQYDDDRVGVLLYYLGDHARDLRAEMERHGDARIRLRAQKAVLSTERTRDSVRDALQDPSPAVRVEALHATRAWDEYPRVLAEDPSADVRRAAAIELRAGTRHTDAILAALKSEQDPSVREALVACLPRRMKQGHAVVDALVAALEEPSAQSRRVAAEALKDVDDGRVAHAFVDRIPREIDRLALYALLGHPLLPQAGAQLYDFVADLFATTTNGELRSAAMHALVGYRRAPVDAALRMLAGGDKFARISARFLLLEVGDSHALAAIRAYAAPNVKAKKELAKVACELQERLGARHTVVVGARVLPLVAKAPILLAGDEVPAALNVAITCEGCRARATVRLDLRWHSMDDDRFAARFTTYAGQTTTPCAACGAALSVEVMAELVEQRADGRRTFEWEGGAHTRGARLVST